MEQHSEFFITRPKVGQIAPRVLRTANLQVKYTALTKRWHLIGQWHLCKCRIKGHLYTAHNWLNLQINKIGFSYINIDAIRPNC